MKSPMPLSKKEFFVLVALLSVTTIALRKEGAHTEEYVWLLPMGFLLLCGAFGSLVTKWRLPVVLGCIMVGAAIANAIPQASQAIKENEFIVSIGELGILLLLFDAGLHSSVHELISAGAKSFRVAVVGVVLPLVGGLLLCPMFFKDASFLQAFFYGSTLTATSVGITMQVLGELGMFDRPERRIILGAAVIDDVLGLMVLAINQQMAGEGSALGAALEVAVTAGTFFAAAAIFGERVSHWVARKFARLSASDEAVTLFLLFWMTMGALAARVLHLEPILGGFAAGWILSDDHVKYFHKRFESSLESRLRSLSTFATSFFFILVGMELELSGVGREILWVSVVVAMMAVFTKWVAGFVTLDRALNPRLIGVGMIPRGEVGIVFARMGLASGLLTPMMFASLILVIAITTGIAIVGLARFRNISTT